MRVRVLKTFTTKERVYEAGEVVEVDPEKAEGWFKTGWIMQDKSLDGAKETKADGRGQLNREVNNE